MDDRLELRLTGCTLALSARRIWEHTRFRQLNPFPRVTAASAAKPQDYVDVVDFSGRTMTLTGLSLSDVLAGKRRKLSRRRVRNLLARLGSTPARPWLADLGRHLREFANERFVRNLPAPFLPADRAGPLGVAGLHCALADWLTARRGEKASADQWRRRIENLAEKGLRSDEVEFALMDERLVGDPERAIRGDAVAKCVSYAALRLSIVPVVYTAERHLTFTRVPANATVKRIKPKPRGRPVTHPQWRDRALGYWIDVVNWDDLLGKQRGWMAFTYRGAPVVSGDHRYGLCATPEEAMALANDHARSIFPRLSTHGLWSQYRSTGGEQYREWLVTLPRYAPSYFSSHFAHRNVLLHVRCDLREGAAGERVLMLQELQSDWAQQRRRALARGGSAARAIPALPWLKEWPALGLKLMLLHAARRGYGALAWTPGEVQVERYEGSGEAGLRELYDRTLPAELTRILRPYGERCESVDVFQPVNFYIDPVESGYEVRDEDDRMLGTATTWSEAQSLVPDVAHEELSSMHGIRLDATLRKALLETGLHAWGTGIR